MTEPCKQGHDAHVEPLPAAQGEIPPAPWGSPGTGAGEMPEGYRLCPICDIATSDFPSAKHSQVLLCLVRCLPSVAIPSISSGLWLPGG